MKLKKLSLGLLALTGLFACTSGQKSHTATQDSTAVTNETPIGVALDDHGCNAAAGESWSQLRQTCLQIFTEGERLDPIEQVKGEAVISAFVLFSTDSTQVELFLPNNQPTIVMTRNTDGVYADGTYLYDASQKVLSVQGTPMYRGATK